jgi:hypothetical protein
MEKIICMQVETTCEWIFGSMVCTSTCIMNDSSVFKLEWYGNEISMSSSDFIGKTVQEIIETKCKKDEIYIRGGVR